MQIFIIICAEGVSGSMEVIMKKVLIMGGSYFIGKKIVDIMKIDNYEITILNRGTKKNEDPTIKQLNCDRNDLSQMKNILKDKKYEVVIDVSCLNAEQATILSQSLNTENLQTIIFISSSAVYKIDELTKPFKESDLVGMNHFWGDYGINKIRAEKYYENFVSNNGIQLIILRPPYVYGENNYAQRESFMFDHIINNKPILIPKSNCSLQFIYTTDLAYIIKTLLNTQLMDQINIFNVGNKESVTVKRWIECCCKAANGKAHVIDYDYVSTGRNIRDFFPFYDYDNILDVSKINKLVIYETDFIEGLKVAFEWFSNNKSKINFKENVTFNEKCILSEINYK